jgi:hypothetical protein
MERDRLRSDLERLHEELARSASIDPASRELLVELARDIESLLERSEDEAAPTSESLIDRLRDATGEFEQSHPALTAVVGRIADLLSRMGI